ncbi:MAG TPA: NAD-dependent epimerase/dehydratase family protein [bacterium]|nr:NAD-dependent epimerase/dehydratase family protein [bacterium]
MPKEVIFDRKNILVIGGAGFIGSHLCEELVVDNKVICLDNLLTGDKDNISHLLQNPNFKFINHDITMAIDLSQQPELRDFKVEFQGLQEVYFLASPASPRDYGRYPIETLAANSLGLKNALDLAVQYKSQLLYASSSAVYGNIEAKKLISEDYVGQVDQLSNRACYSEAKRFGETLVNNYRLKHNIDAKIVRISNCYGPRMRLDDGRLIPEVIRAAIHSEPINILGGPKDKGAYFFISDLIKGLMKTMEAPETGPFNLASEWQMTFKELAEKIVAMTGSNSAINYQQSDRAAIQPVLDISAAKEKLGWFPVVLFDEGAKETIDYLSAQKDVLRPTE